MMIGLLIQNALQSSPLCFKKIIIFVLRVYFIKQCMVSNDGVINKLIVLLKRLIN